MENIRNVDAVDCYYIVYHRQGWVLVGSLAGFMNADHLPVLLFLIACLHGLRQGTEVIDH